MTLKKSNLTLYILKFKDLPFIKIGKSKTLAVRINKFRKEYEEEFDLQNSYAIGCHNASKIKALEYELLTNTVEFKLIGDYFEKFKNLDGSTEIREDICLPLILKLVKYKAKLTGEFHIYSSISLEKNVKAELPTSIFNEFGETPYIPINISEKIIASIKENVVEFKDYDNEEITNRILSTFLKNKKIKIDSKEPNKYKRKKGMNFPNLFKSSDWFWQNPNSKLKDIDENKQ